MPENATQGLPEIARQDVDKPDQLVFKLNLILRSLSSQIAGLLGVSGPARMGAGPYEFTGQASFQKGITVAGQLVLLGTTDRSGNTKALRFASLTEYADDAAAKAGGLNAGDLYRTAAGVVMVVVP